MISCSTNVMLQAQSRYTVYIQECQKHMFSNSLEHYAIIIKHAEVVD